MKKNLDLNIIDRSKIKQDTVNMIDDSNSVVEFEEPEEANEHIRVFFEVLKVNYNTMKLELNDDNTQFLVVRCPNKNTVA